MKVNHNSCNMIILTKIFLKKNEIIRQSNETKAGSESSVNFILMKNRCYAASELSAECSLPPRRCYIHREGWNFHSQAI